MYSGFAAYSSGVKHQGKMPWITMSVVLPRAFAMVCQVWTTARRYGSVQPLCSERDRTSDGCFAASQSGRE